jgi:hypothetical protein
VQHCHELHPESEGPDGKDEYYNVHDFYRLRTNQGEVLLVDLNRDTEQVFQPSEAVYEDEESISASAPSDRQLRDQRKSGVLRFRTGGDLWMIGSSEIPGRPRVQLPRRRSAGRAHERNASQIRICNRHDDGVVTFVVTGYMNSGRMRATGDIRVHVHLPSTNLLEEELFINTDQNWEMLNKNLSLLTYFNENHVLYTYTGTQLLRTELSSGKSEVIKDMVNPGVHRGLAGSALRRLDG